MTLAWRLSQRILSVIGAPLLLSAMITVIWSGRTSSYAAWTYQ